jgi:GNAT superfamily N-acetyltransferase
MREPVKGATLAGFPREDAIRALEGNLWDLWSNFGRGPGCTLYEEGGALWFDTPIPTLPYNAVLRFTVTQRAEGQRPSHVDTRIDTLVAHYRRRGVPCMWIVHPTAQPADLGERLLARGLEESELVTGMVADLEHLPEAPPVLAGIEVHEADDETDVRHVFELISWRWQIPPEAKDHHRALNEAFMLGTPEAKVRCWLACRDGVPVSKVVLNCAAGAAGIHGVATKPEARKLGLARLLTILALQQARQEGYRMAVLHSSPMAVSLYAKLGFEAAADFWVYTSGVLHL